MSTPVTLIGEEKSHFLIIADRKRAAVRVADVARAVYDLTCCPGYDVHVHFNNGTKETFNWRNNEDASKTEEFIRSVLIARKDPTPWGDVVSVKKEEA